MPDEKKKTGPLGLAERHGRDLEVVNERLKELVASLQTEKARFLATPAPLPPPPAPPSAAPGVDDLEVRGLAAELALAREAVAHANEERARLRARLAEIEAENERICDEYVAVQERSTELAQRCVALERLHAGLSRAETLAAIQDIVVNVVGSEEVAILDRAGETLRLVQSFGIDPEPLRTVRLGEGAIGRAATTGRLYVAGREGPPEPGDGDLTAAVPLCAGAEVVGVLAIFRLLGHKPGLGEGDQEVFDLLSSHAGLALHLRRGAAAAG
jgi:GAF domain-containing protein